MKVHIVTCPHCEKPLHVPLAAAMLVPPSAAGEPRSMWFVCTRCEDLVGRAVPPSFTAALLANGIQVIHADVPTHPESRPDGPALSHDDLLALHDLLADDAALADAVQDLLAAPPTS